MTTSGEAGISSTTAPAPRHSPRAAWHPDVRPIRLRGPLGSLVGAPGATLVALMGLAVALAIGFWMIGDQPVIFDADNYVFHANILAHGPLSSWGFRTYGYPAFVLPWLLLAGGNTDALRGWIFIAQLAVHLGASWFFARRMAAAFGDGRLGRLSYVLVVLNPFLLIMTGLLLSDLLSAALIAVCAGLLLPSPGRTPAAVLREGMLSLALLAFSVEVRPANDAKLPVGTALWLAQWWLAARPNRRRFYVGLALVGAVAALPFIPQVALNLVAHGAASPLVVNSLYGSQLIWGMQSLKYATFVLRDYPVYPAVFYVNPFDPGQPSLRFFAETNPLGLVATWTLHAFGLFDQDYPFPFVRETDGWYRWPLSVLGYLFLWSAVIGLVIGW